MVRGVKPTVESILAELGTIRRSEGKRIMTAGVYCRNNPDTNSKAIECCDLCGSPRCALCIFKGTCVGGCRPKAHPVMRLK